MTAGRSPVELLDALDTLRAKATPGPWLSGAKDGAVAVTRSAAEHGSHDGSTFAILHPGPEMWSQQEAMANARLCTEMHHHLPALVAALRAVLGLADEIDVEAQGRWARTLQARGEGDRDAAFGERGAGDALHDASLRIRAAVAAALAPEGGQAE